MKIINNNVRYNNTSWIETLNNDLVFRCSATSQSVGYVDNVYFDKITTEIDPYTGFSAEITITDKNFYDKIINLYTNGSREAMHVTPKKYQIKKVVANPKKNATTVIFEDGTVTVVKKSPDDPEADIFSVVAYAVAKRIYGSNSAFKREVVEHLEFIDKDLEKVLDRPLVDELNNFLRSVIEATKKGGKK